MRGHDNQAGGLPREEHSNGQSSVVGSMRQTPSSQASRLRTRNVVRRIDTWSVLKVSAVFYIAVYCILLVASSLLWFAASQTGLRENVEKVIADLIASGKFHFVGGELLRAGAIGGAMLVFLGTAGNVMLSVLYNLISDLVGGVSIVVEERSAQRVGRVPADDPVKQLPAVEPHRTTTELAPPEPVKILVPQVEQRPEPQQPTQPQAPQPEPRPQGQPQTPRLPQPQQPQPQPQSTRPQAPQPASGPEAQPSQPKPQAQPETQTSRLPQPQQSQKPQNPQPPQPQAQPPQPQAQPPQPEPAPQPEPSQPRLPLPNSAPSPEMPDEQLLGAERAADGNLEAFGL